MKAFVAVVAVVDADVGNLVSLHRTNPSPVPLWLIVDIQRVDRVDKEYTE